MAKRLLSLSLMLAAGSIGVQAQNTVLKADTAMVTGTGPTSGKTISATVGTAGSAGSNIARELRYRVAEDFVIPSGESWRIDSLITYSYETGATTTTITAGQVQLWNGVPGSGGTMIAGDTSTNRLGTVAFTNIYRVFNTALNDTNRRIMRLAMAVPATTPTSLAAGTYWVSWSATGNATLTGPWAPFQVTPSGTNPTGQNGRLDSAYVSWRPVLDGTDNVTPVGFNFILKGAKTTGIRDINNVSSFSLGMPFPNPASGSTNISFTLTTKNRISVQIVNAAGQRVATVVEDEMTAGEYHIPFSTANLASGVYRITLQTEDGTTAVPLTVR